LLLGSAGDNFFADDIVTGVDIGIDVWVSLYLTLPSSLLLQFLLLLTLLLHVTYFELSRFDFNFVLFCSCIYLFQIVLSRLIVLSVLLFHFTLLAWMGGSCCGVGCSVDTNCGDCGGVRVRVVDGSWF
jgi:hypothetical protein